MPAQREWVKLKFTIRLHSTHCVFALRFLCNLNLVAVLLWAINSPFYSTDYWCWFQLKNPCWRRHENETFSMRHSKMGSPWCVVNIQYIQSRWIKFPKRSAGSAFGLSLRRIHLRIIIEGITYEILSNDVGIHEICKFACDLSSQRLSSQILSLRLSNDY